MGFGNKSYIADKMLKHLSDEQKVSIRNMSDEELIELNKAWGHSICHGYRLGGFRFRGPGSGSHPAHLSLELLKIVREKLQDDEMEP